MLLLSNACHKICVVAKRTIRISVVAKHAVHPLCLPDHDMKKNVLVAKQDICQRLVLNLILAACPLIFLKKK